MDVPDSVLDAIYSFPEWQDDVLMHALYRSYDFHEDEEFMLDFWRRVINDITDKGKNVYSVEEFSALMERNGTQPIGLMNIATELGRRGDIGWEEDLDRELKENRNKSWGNWLKKKAKGLFGQEIRKSTVFFSTKVLEIRCKGVTDWVEQEHKHGTIEEFVLQSHLSVCCYSETEAKIILSYLQTQSKAAFHTVAVGESSVPVYKFRFQRDSPLEMTASDYTILAANAAKYELNAFISHLECIRDANRSEILRLVDSEQRNSAIRLLKRVKATETVLDNCYEKKAQIESILFDAENEKGEETANCDTNSETNQMKFAQKTPIAEINSLLTDIQEQKRLSEELGEVVGDSKTEEEWEEELNSLRKDEAAREFVEVPQKLLRKKRKRPKQEDLL